LDDNDKEFFLSASKIIYDWLPYEKKTKLSLELSSEEISDIWELKEKELFFRLMHFLETNYIRIGDWMDKTTECVEKINGTQINNKVRDIEIELTEGQKTRISEARKEFFQSGIKDLFYSTIESLNLRSEYKRYVDSKQGVSKDE
jgi:hypothetical protein